MTDRFDVKGYSIPGTKEMIVTFDSSNFDYVNDLYIMDSEGTTTYIKEGGKYTVKGDTVNICIVKMIRIGWSPG